MRPLLERGEHQLIAVLGSPWGLQAPISFFPEIPKPDPSCLFPTTSLVFFLGLYIISILLYFFEIKHFRPAPRIPSEVLVPSQIGRLGIRFVLVARSGSRFLLLTVPRA